MKANKFFAAVMAAMTLVGFSACKGEGKTPEAYKLNETKVSVEVGKTFQLEITPKATATWESSDPTKATVDANGLVTGVAVGNAIVSAKVGEEELSAFVTVTETQKEEGGEGEGGKQEEDKDRSGLHKSLQGSEYFLFVLDGTTFNRLPSSVIVADYRPNDVTSFIDVWASGETYNAGTTSGKNFYGEAEGWVAFECVAPAGWSGGGIRSIVEGGEAGNDANKLLDKIMAAPDDYYFHVAMKSTDDKSHHFRLYGTSEVDIIIGAAQGAKDFDGNDCDVFFTRDGSWQEIEVPMSFFTKKGLVFNSTAKLNNYVLGWVSGGQVGAQLQFDACFIYKK